MRAKASKIVTTTPLPHLRAWRIWLGISPKELARRADLHVSRINALELYNEPALLSTVARLAEALGISRVALLHMTPEEAGMQEWTRTQQAAQRPHAVAS